MKKKMFFLLFLLFLFLAQKASAFCNTISTRVYITMNPGNVKYITTQSRYDFIRSAPYPVSPNTLGLTVAQLSITGEARPNVETENGQSCVSLGTLDFKMGYENLVVYIDKKYKPSSCEYQVIKNHENYHVAVAQQAMVFFKPDIEAQIQKSLQKIKPQIVRNNTERNEVLQKQFDLVMNDLRPLIDHINKTTAKKNFQIDTPEAYEKTKALCKNW